MPKKTLSQEEKDAITEWFIHEYWPTYPGKWCRGGKGSRSTCLNLMLEKHQPDENERRRILGNLKAQIFHDRKVPDRKWWKMCDTYTRNGLWEDEIESIEEPIKQELGKCKCGQFVHGPKYSTCGDCLLREHERWKNHRIRALRDLNLLHEGSTYQQVVDLCKERGSVGNDFSLSHLMRVSNVQENKKS